MFTVTDKSTDTDKDRFFKSIPPDWYEEESGDVESPQGWFGLVKVNSDMIGKDDIHPIPAGLDDGLYLVVVDNAGLIWAFQGDGETQEESALITRWSFNQRAQAFCQWADETEGDES